MIKSMHFEFIRQHRLDKRLDANNRMLETICELSEDPLKTLQKIVVQKVWSMKEMLVRTTRDGTPVWKKLVNSGISCGADSLIWSICDYTYKLDPDFFNNENNVIPVIMLRGEGMLESVQLLEYYSLIFDIQSISLHRPLIHSKNCPHANYPRDCDRRQCQSIPLGENQRPEHAF